MLAPLPYHETKNKVDGSEFIIKIEFGYEWPGWCKYDYEVKALAFTIDHICTISENMHELHNRRYRHTCQIVTQLIHGWVCVRLVKLGKITLSARTHAHLGEIFACWFQHLHRSI